MTSTARHLVDVTNAVPAASRSTIEYQHRTATFLERLAGTVRGGRPTEVHGHTRAPFVGVMVVAWTSDGEPVPFMQGAPIENAMAKNRAEWDTALREAIRALHGVWPRRTPPGWDEEAGYWANVHATVHAEWERANQSRAVMHALEEQKRMEHERINPFLCGTCHRRFKSQGGLTRHTNVRHATAFTEGDT